MSAIGGSSWRERVDAWDVGDVEPTPAGLGGEAPGEAPAVRGSSIPGPAVLAPALTDPLAFDPLGMPELRAGSAPAEQTRVLQLALNVWRERMGMRPLRVDGAFGRRTAAALREVQRALGLPADGTVETRDWQALRRMLDARQPVLDPWSARIEPGFDPAAMPELRFGQGDPEQVAVLQSALNSWRLSRNRAAIATDGHFGAETRMAVMQFQRCVGLTPTGIVDRATWERLAAVQVRDRGGSGEPVALDVPWISQFDTTGRVERPGDTACYRAATRMVREYLANQGIDAALEDVWDRIDVGRRERTRAGRVVTDRAAAQAARNYIDRCLEAGLPVIVGVSCEAGNAYNANPVTDHFVVITGRGVDAEGRPYYTYNDPSVTERERGSGRMVLNEQGNLVKDGRTDGQGLVADRHWEVSEVRTWHELP
ncbi:MAG: hypothetical protein KatS3mg102_2351 [Planctomycetota bacterium]|nr:MAG: hypothetical protein KatS3mg102_2351 [Planctomycetota bacterium]